MTRDHKCNEGFFKDLKTRKALWWLTKATEVNEIIGDSVGIPKLSTPIPYTPTESAAINIVKNLQKTRVGYRQGGEWWERFCVLNSFHQNGHDDCRDDENCNQAGVCQFTDVSKETKRIDGEQDNQQSDRASTNEHFQNWV